MRAQCQFGPLSARRERDRALWARHKMSVFESVQHCGEPPASAVCTVRNTRMPFPHTVQGCAVVSAAWRLNARHRTQDLPGGVDSGLLAIQIILCILQYIGTRGGQSRDDFRAQNQQTACLASQQHMSTWRLPHAPGSRIVFCNDSQHNPATRRLPPRTSEASSQRRRQGPACWTADPANPMLSWAGILQALFFGAGPPFRTC